MSGYLKPEDASEDADTPAHTLSMHLIEHQCQRRSAMQTGKIKQEEKLHEKEIRDMNIYKDGTHLATASVDKTVKLIDMQTLEVLKVYQTDRPANAVALSPIFDQVRSHLSCSR